MTQFHLNRRSLSPPLRMSLSLETKVRMLKWQYIVLIIALTVSVFSTNSSAGASSNADVQPGFPIRAAFYYPWFPESWTQLGIYPYTNYHPSAGYYDSSSATTIIGHISAMQYGGIQAGILSWWGQGTPTDKRVPTILSLTNTTGATFRWSIYYEPESTGNPTVSQISSDLTYIQAHYGNDPSFLRVNGRFVVFVYADGSDNCAMADRWKQANTVNAYVVLKVFSGYQTCASQPAGWHQYGPAVAADSQKNYSYTISPGFWKVGETARLTRDLTSWNQNIRDMITSGAPFQLITTFNEWGEGTSVESAAEWNSASGYGAYLDALHNNGGAVIQPTPTNTSAVIPTFTATSFIAPTATKIVLPTSTVVSTPTVLATVSSSATSVTFPAAADARVAQQYPSTNYGTSTYLQADANSGAALSTYVRFNVNNIAGSVVSAKLRIYCTTNGTANGPAAYLADSNWIESGTGSITWNNKPALLSGTYDNKTSIATSSWVEYNVTGLVSANGTYTFALVGDSTDGVTFSSREGSYAPQLVLTVNSGTVPTPVSNPTNTPISTFTNTPAPTQTVQATSTSTALPTVTVVSSSGSIKHVFLVIMENHSYSEVWNTSSTPYITSLGNQYARATNYKAITHPSLPNYLDLFGGSNYSITTDCSPSSSCHINAVNLADNLEAKGLTWKGYMESMPSPCYLTTSGKYAPKHNPMVYFDDIYQNTARCQAHDLPYTALAVDLASAATTPNFSIITPDLCSDMHDCSISIGDTWLKNNLPAMLNSPACTVDKCLLVLTWDEDDSSQSNQVLMIFAGSAAKTGGITSSASYNHFSLLRTVENIFGLPTQTNNDAATNPMTDLLR
jgi:phosphoesterase family protein/glycosyl hydrolase family 99